MEKYKYLKSLALVILVLFLTSCARNTTSLPGADTTKTDKRALFVTDTIDSESSDYVWEILQKCAERYSYQLTLAEVQGQADKASATLNQASEGLYDIVIIDRLASEMAAEWVLRNAGYYPEVRYLCLDVAQEEETSFPNVTCVIWEDAAAYYYYGAMAALNCGENTVAFLAAEVGERAEMDFLAFYAGVTDVDNAVRALYYTLGSKPEAINIKTVVNSALDAGADVICLQRSAIADAVAEELMAREEQIHLLLAEPALSMEAEYTTENVLSHFSFHTDTLLEELFRDCFGGRLKSGDCSMAWLNGALAVETGSAYPGALTEEEQEVLRVVKRNARKNEISTLPDPAWTQEERQEKIQTAGETGK